MNRIKREQLRRRKARIARRLENSSAEDRGQPMLNPQNIQYEMSERTHGIAAGGIGAMHALAKKVGLIERIDEGLHLLKIHRPYHESDHVLNIALNVLSGGQCLEDLELRRNDETFLDALGAERIPDPTTAGDFCRRFDTSDIYQLMDIIDETRLDLWKRQPDDFFEQAIIEMDGSIVPTTGECKEGMDISFKGIWGFHPLLVSLANTGEVLRIVNRSGNRPSYEGADREVDKMITLCKRGGFRKILLRGDTDFTQTQRLDEWDATEGVQFIFGMAVHPTAHVLCDDLPEEIWEFLERRPRYEVKTKPRARPDNVKQEIVEQRKFRKITLVSESIAECAYRPTACSKDYRLIVVRKDLKIENDPQLRLYDDYRYFLYLTNDWETPADQIVFSANARCQQENLIEQQKNGVRSLRAPLDSLNSNWAYMVMTALAWNMKAWVGLMLPESPRWKSKHREEKQLVLRMEFKRFLNSFMLIPCQIVRTGRTLVYRLLSWNPHVPIFRRLLIALE